MEQLSEVGGRVLIPTDREFPASLTLIPDSPTVLFTTGHVEWLEPPAVAIDDTWLSLVNRTGR